MADRGKTPRLDALQFRAWRAFLYAYTQVVPALDRELSSASGVGLSQYEIMMWLRRAGPRGLRMSDLASLVVLSPSGVTRAVDQLERKGFVERAIVEEDRRAWVAKLTPEGRAVLRSATKVHVQGVQDHLVRHVRRTDLENIARALEAVLEGEGSPLPPLTAR